MSKTDKLVTLIPLEELEQEAQSQIYEALDHDFLIKLAIMPDCHTGYSLPIGGVALLDAVISPAYVGYDIGCGMCHLATSLRLEHIEDLQALYKEIKESIPNGEGNEQKRQFMYSEFPDSTGNKDAYAQRVQSKLNTQLGTLGGGNHFIELGLDPDGNICVTIHSGSRNPGHSVGGHYMKLSNTNDTDLPPGFLHLGSDLGQAYLTDMEFMLVFALENRRMMMKQVLKIMGYDPASIESFLKYNMINENHNHAVVSYTEDNPKGTVLHRKGATPADKGQLGVIPGNMRDGVFVTVGLGNEHYLSSSSHGAGRKMSRKKAKEVIGLETFQSQMKGIVAGTDASLLDEAPDAYKDLDHVIKLQKGIVVDVVYHTRPILNVKGSGSIKPWEKKKMKGLINE